MKMSIDGWSQWKKCKMGRGKEIVKNRGKKEEKERRGKNERKEEERRGNESLEEEEK